MYSMQRFVDQYGRGPFLQRIDVSRLLSLFIYVDECLKLDNHIVSSRKYPSPTQQNYYYEHERRGELSP
jgi:hypothetical protein